MTRRTAKPKPIPSLLPKLTVTTAKPKIRPRTPVPSCTHQDAGRKGADTAKQRSPSPAPQIGMGLHTADGARKYLTAGERDAFLARINGRAWFKSG